MDYNITGLFNKDDDALPAAAAPTAVAMMAASASKQDVCFYMDEPLQLQDIPKKNHL